MEHRDLMDVLVAGFTFGNTLLGGLIGGVVLLRQSRNAAAQRNMHAENKDAIADLKDHMTEIHK